MSATLSYPSPTRFYNRNPIQPYQSIGDIRQLYEENESLWKDLEQVDRWSLASDQALLEYMNKTFNSIMLEGENLMCGVEDLNDYAKALRLDLKTLNDRLSQLSMVQFMENCVGGEEVKKEVKEKRVVDEKKVFDLNEVLNSAMEIMKNADCVYYRYCCDGDGEREENAMTTGKVEEKEDNVTDVNVVENQNMTSSSSSDDDENVNVAIKSQNVTSSSDDENVNVVIKSQNMTSSSSSDDENFVSTLCKEKESVGGVDDEMEDKLRMTSPPSSLECNVVNLEELMNDRDPVSVLLREKSNYWWDDDTLTGVNKCLLKDDYNKVVTQQPLSKVQDDLLNERVEKWLLEEEPPCCYQVLVDFKPLECPNISRVRFANRKLPSRTNKVD